MKPCVVASVVILALFDGSRGEQRTQLIIETKKCVEGYLFHPAAGSVAVFDVSKVPELARLAHEFEENENPSDQKGAEKMLSIYETLRAQVERTPALYRQKRALESRFVFTIEPVPRVVVFAFDDREDELTSYARQELDITAGKPNLAVLNFSPESDCKSAQGLTARPRPGQ